MKSMTGYGHGKVQTLESLIEVSVRSVNGRFLEPRFHLPREYIAFEGELKKILQKNFSRGTMDVYVLRRVRWDQVESKVVVQNSLVKEYDKALRQIAKSLKTKFEPSVEAMARMPDVLKIETQDHVSSSEKKALLKAMETACAACVTERTREGASLKHDMEKSLKALENLVGEIMKVREEVNKGLQAKVEQKLKSRFQGGELDPARLSQEVVFLLDKSDINEELVRLKEHTKNYRALLSTPGSLGKKLDFYTQELLREVNTIGSKSSVSQLTQNVVEAKTLIERLREQVQNIE
ncbi:MAG: YicC family protein [Bdellovibrionaceae bacterium]|nr:YicC family protein [Pseudobdellovibrionaceae bacterium]